VSCAHGADVRHTIRQCTPRDRGGGKKQEAKKKNDDAGEGRLPTSSLSTDPPEWVSISFNHLWMFSNDCTHARTHTMFVSVIAAPRRDAPGGARQVTLRTLGSVMS
jgi:hypothetical protein